MTEDERKQLLQLADKLRALAQNGEGIRDKLAEACGQDLSRVVDIVCPRYIKNPGGYFGFVRGWNAAVAYIMAKEKL